jgi:tetrahydromethanopterin S-methyltransferase subunit B
MVDPTIREEGLTDRELIQEMTTVVSYLAGQLERLDDALQARLAERRPPLRSVPSRVENTRVAGGSAKSDVLGDVGVFGVLARDGD